MTTISLSAPVRPHRLATPSRTRLRLTVRGRRVLTAVAALPVAIAFAATVLAGTPAVASGDTAGAPVVFETVTVDPGDTLWAIAERVAPGADPRDVVGEIIRLNALGSGAVDVGQAIAIPQEYASAG